MKQRIPRRPLPPYGRQVSERLRGDLQRYNGTSPDGSRAQIVVAVGSEAMGWPPDNPRNLAVAIPPGEDPLAFRWDWAARHAPALITPTGSASALDYERTAGALLRDGAGLAVAALESGWTRFQRRDAA